MDDTEDYVAKDMEFQLIEIFNQEPLDPTPEMLERDPKAKKVDVNKKNGQTLMWIQSEGDEGKYLVQTFDGDVIGIAEQNLRVFVPSPVSEGGFDVAWPASIPRQELFATDVGQVLLEQSVCIVQMASSPKQRRSAFEAAAAQQDWTRLMYEFEPVYMGRNASGKVSWVQELQPRGDDEEDGLLEAERMLTEMGFALMSISEAFGFNAQSRSNSMMRLQCSTEEESRLTQVFESSDAVVDSQEISDHLAFKQRKKFCMFFFVSGSGGSLILHPEDKDADPISIPIEENRIVVFRNDLMDFTYKPESAEQLAMCAWILREPHEGETGLGPQDVEPIDFSEVPEGPAYGESGEKVDCMAVCDRMPGEVWNCGMFWALLAGGGDAIGAVPQSRWDHDQYWSPDNEPGKGYVRHFGMLDAQQMAQFDNEFFGIAEEEALFIDPPQRVSMEVGYECFHKGGWTKKTLQGAKIALSCGYSDTEFDGMVHRGVFGINHLTKISRENATYIHRMAFLFGIKGPASNVETACSSSLTATALAHTWMRPQEPQQAMHGNREKVSYALCMGSNGHFDPFYTISLCAASMLTHMGRCFTFDQSADGFVRGEGTGAMYYKVSQGEDFSKLAMLCGTCMNQDGRSASLTAPHGPSQQECIRHSLREAGILALDIQIQELHGTGTALGDPIEVGALRATMMTVKGVTRDHPLVKTSSKSNIGHTEMCAGICGIMKCVLMGVKCCAAPNIHLRLLNPHIDANGYPVYFSPEMCDQGKGTGYHGVSSFGFGGSNARGDIWARALSGPRNTNPGTPLLDLSAQRLRKFNKHSMPKETQLEVGGLEATAYEGLYLTGSGFSPENLYFITGTFCGWQSMERMIYSTEMGGWGYAITLGEAKVEEFQIVCNMYEDAKVFPVCKTKDPDTLILGPGTAPQGQNWVIDGREDGTPQGSVYLVLFSWDAQAKRKRITWSVTDNPVVLAVAEGLKYKHSYSIVGSWNGYRCIDMQPVPGEPGTYETFVRIGLEGEEEFQFWRNRHRMQAIYPAMPKAMRTAVPVRGPDDRGEQKNWIVRGPTGEGVRIQLQVWEGDISVTISSDTKGTKTWTNQLGEDSRTYFVTASWNNWGFTQMTQSRKNVYTTKMVVESADKLESFNVVVDRDTHQVIHPEMEYAPLEVSLAQGPDDKGKSLYWAFAAQAGTSVKITLDLTQTDKRQMVIWEDEGEQTPALEGHEFE